MLPEMTTRNESSTAILESGFLSSYEESDTSIALKIVGILICLLGNYVVTPIISMQWLTCRAWSDREADSIHDLRLGDCKGLLMSTPEPVCGAQKLVTYSLVEWMHDDFLGASPRIGNQAITSPCLWREEVAFPGLVCVEKWSQISFTEREQSTFVRKYGRLDILSIWSRCS